MLSLFSLSFARRSVRPARSTSSRKWRKLVWPLVLAGLCRPGIPTAKITEVFMLRLTGLNDANLRIADGVLDAGDGAALRDAVFYDSFGGGFEHTLLFFSVVTTTGCFLALFVCRDYVDYALMRVVPVPAFDVAAFAGRQLIYPV